MNILVSPRAAKHVHNHTTRTLVTSSSIGDGSAQVALESLTLSEVAQQTKAKRSPLVVSTLAAVGTGSIGALVGYLASGLAGLGPIHIGVAAVGLALGGAAGAGMVFQEDRLAASALLTSAASGLGFVAALVAGDPALAAGMAGIQLGSLGLGFALAHSRAQSLPEHDH